jgi:two-component system, NarL family, nitrate/nitrite response regulator NarL
MRLRILLVSDVRVVQEGVHAILAQWQGVEVVSSVDMPHARCHCEELQPDVVLLDAARPDSVEFARALVATLPRTRVVAFGVKETDAEILALAAAGTNGYVRDSAAGSELVAVLERVMCDELPCSARAAASLYRQVALLSQGSEPAAAGTAGDLAATPLSRRELQIACLIDRGLTNKQIGRELGIEPATVKNHVHNLCEKLHVHRRGEATARMRALLGVRTALPSALPSPAGDAHGSRDPHDRHAHRALGQAEAQ